MTITYDLGTILGQVRMLIQDQAGTLFSDEELAVIIADTTAGGKYEAAALALETIGNNKALLAQAISIGRYSSNTSDAARHCREAAAAMRDMCGTGAAATAEISVTDFSARRIVVNRELREQ